MKLAVRLGNITYRFQDLKEVFAKANEEKSGDQLAGIGASTVQQRIAAKIVLSEITLEEIRKHPLIPYETDEVTRLIDQDLNNRVYEEIKGWTVAELREYILQQHVDSDELKRLSKGLNSEMIAAVTKLMSNLDLIHVANKIEIITTNQTTIGFKGTLSSRCQPNHPTDDVEGIMIGAMEGYSFGVGDAVLGINPVNDTVESIKRVLHGTKDFITRWDIPTQNCVLGHITTQMEAIRQGAPCDLIFQSIAGTQKANDAFGISINLLDEAKELMTQQHGTEKNVFYFETGQGSALSSEAHFGVDQLTLEARNYGLARHYRPFIVNTVVGFIGPEYLYDSKQVIRAGLEDHFMGKMHGLPMGVDICYTNHIVADQNDIENLGVLLAGAGVNFVIGVPMGDDVMLNYQSLSYHDIATLHQTLNKPPAPEFVKWLEKMGIYENGKLSKRAGDISIFQTHAL
ncbi:ethanolamine ammonia-lyase subunit EutB [Ureibacillus sp. FSL K6-3587]|uniref:ethanolamine ammonia-lyase subunit EutB n=1 Tax=Ureibacillus sp. FSL K6-3587 TaxID=2954681 RepID=UPI003158FF56